MVVNLVGDSDPGINTQLVIDHCSLLIIVICPTDEINAPREKPRAMKFTRITVNPNQMGGVPCIRHLRIPVATIVEMLAEGMGEAEILEAYPDLEAADLSEALRYAAVALQERELPLVT